MNSEYFSRAKTEAGIMRIVAKLGELPVSIRLISGGKKVPGDQRVFVWSQKDDLGLEILLKAIKARNGKPFGLIMRKLEVK